MADLLALTLVAGLLAIVPAPSAQAAIAQGAMTWNLQGKGQNAWEVPDLMETNDVTVAALQEVANGPFMGLTPTNHRVNYVDPDGTPSSPPTWQVEQYTLSDDYGTAFVIQTGSNNRRLAIVTTLDVANVATDVHVLNVREDWKGKQGFPALGVKVDGAWYYSIHATTQPRRADNNANTLVEDISSLHDNTDKGDWAAMGDWNRYPSEESDAYKAAERKLTGSAKTNFPGHQAALDTVTDLEDDERIIWQGARTHDHGAELDYMVAKGADDGYVATRATSKSGSDHWPVFFNPAGDDDSDTCMGGTSPAPANAPRAAALEACPINDLPTAAFSMGDSYISGEAGRWQGNANTSLGGDSWGTDRAAGGSQIYEKNRDGSDACHRSDVAEIKGAEIAGIPRDRMFNIACSGAETKHLLSESFKGEAPQIEQLAGFAEELDVNTIAVSIGGNDLGFADIVEKCAKAFMLGQGACRDSADRSLRDQLDDVGDDVGRVLAAIRDTMAEAGQDETSYRLIVQGYPAPLPPADEMRYPGDHYDRYTQGGCPFYDDDLRWTRDGAIDGISAMLRKAADDTGAAFLDLKDAFAGHELCAKTARQAKSGETLGNPMPKNEAEWVRFVNGYTTPGDKAEGIHPNAHGQAALSGCLSDALQRMGVSEDTHLSCAGRRDFKIRSMALGSSTTWGQGSSHGNGYREVAGFGLQWIVDHQSGGGGSTSLVDWVGSVKVGTMADRDVEGWRGFRIHEIAKKAECAVKTYQPNLITLIAGGNDVTQDYEMGGAIGRLESLIEQISRDAPGTVVLVAGIQPYHDAATNARGKAYSAQIPGLVNRLAGRGLRVVYTDITALTGTDTGPDGVHPNDQGYEKIGEAFAKAAVEARDRNWIRPPNPQAPDAGSNPCGSWDDGSGGPETDPYDLGQYWEGRGIIQSQVRPDAVKLWMVDIDRDRKAEQVVVKRDGSFKFYWNGGPDGDDWKPFTEGEHPFRPHAGANGDLLRFPDLDGDGHPDCAFVNTDGTMTVYRWDWSKPKGQRMCAIRYVGDPHVQNDGKTGGKLTPPAGVKVRFADVTGGGRDDFVIIRPDGTTTAWFNENFKTDRTLPYLDWQPLNRVAASRGESSEIRNADLNGDERDDRILITPGGGARAWINEGPRGGFSHYRDIGKIADDSGISPFDVHFPDVDGDGKADFVRMTSDGRISAWINKLPADYFDAFHGSGEPMNEPRKLGPHWDPRGVIQPDTRADAVKLWMTDIDRDRKAEQVVVKRDGSFQFYWNNGSSGGNWKPFTPGEHPFRPHAGADGDKLRFPDLDGDGHPDCAFVETDGTMKVYRWDWSKPKGQRMCAIPYDGDANVYNEGKTGGKLAPPPGSKVRFADITGRGRDDYLIIRPDGTTAVWINQNFQNNGELAWFEPMRIFDGGDGDREIRHADLNGDNLDDRILVTPGGGARAWISVPGELFSAFRDIGKIAEDSGASRFDVHFPDIDGDGKADFARMTSNGQVTAWLNKLPDNYFDTFHP
ncbi:FG-GAP-like repeat-containing protein [Spongiactinospora sp. TRM90649]|uniref:FG-GAP-like repeat-containing protein n=1 Tax=Spongiactinospora sp. TRM90649 TaxID=3031114 RepID=UPI0023FA3C32|nr:FG-GAP-like repeat-containing protein [Spongiactinospora sp. TRM90649]MDF5752424.1 FG-GAP-like repeat-containing protein [Spongiactinospora sp. TRM90649]